MDPISRQRQPAFGRAVFSEAPDRDESEISPLVDQVPEGWSEAGIFRVFSGKIAVGAFLDDHSPATIVLPSVNGDSFAFERANQSGDEDELTEFIVTERRRVSEIKSFMKRLDSRGFVPVHGGSILLLDEEVRDDPEYIKRMNHGVPLNGRGVRFD